MLWFFLNSDTTRFSNTDRQTAPPVEVPPVLKNNCGINEEESGNNLYESIS